MAADSPRSSDELAAELYDALRSFAVRALWRGSHLDPTDLIHQAWVRLAHADKFETMARPEFLALCATVMRRIAVDEGRRRAVERRSPQHITFSAIASADGTNTEVDVLALEEALKELEALDERWGRIVELRFFGGLTGEETADAMSISRRTVVREWDLARAWLKRRLR